MKEASRTQQQIEAEEEKKMSHEIGDLLKPEKQRCGLTGLKNLGNTCFMNSVLQCLANTEPLVKFFLFEVYQSHINTRNQYGTRGKLA